MVAAQGAAATAAAAAAAAAGWREAQTYSAGTQLLGQHHLACPHACWHLRAGLPRRLQGGPAVLQAAALGGGGCPLVAAAGCQGPAEWAVLQASLQAWTMAGIVTAAPRRRLSDCPWTGGLGGSGSLPTAAYSVTCSC